MTPLVLGDQWGAAAARLMATKGTDNRVYFAVRWVDDGLNGPVLAGFTSEEAMRLRDWLDDYLEAVGAEPAYAVATPAVDDPDGCVMRKGASGEWYSVPLGEVPWSEAVVWLELGFTLERELSDPAAKTVVRRRLGSGESAGNFLRASDIMAMWRVLPCESDTTSPSRR